MNVVFVGVRVNCNVLCIKSFIIFSYLNKIREIFVMCIFKCSYFIDVDVELGYILFGLVRLVKVRGIRV